MTRRFILPCLVVLGALCRLSSQPAQAQNISAAINAISRGSTASTQNLQPIALGAYYYDGGSCAPGDARAVASWKARTGRLPAVWMIFQSWTDWNRFPVAQARQATAMGSRLMVTWEPWSGNPLDTRWSCDKITNGTYDSYIASYARAVKSAGVPVLIRFAHEMNGGWYPWGTAYSGAMHRNNNNQPSDYVAMWKHVVSIFRRVGADNALWVWAPNVLAPNNYNTESDQMRDIAAMYPGDDWVDWVGLSVYNDGTKRRWMSFSTVFDSAYRTVTNLTQKPLMIAEIGVTEQGAPYGQSKASWIQQTFLSDIPYRYNRVRLVNYFCRDKTSFGESNYRFDSSAASLQAFRNVVNSPLYQGRLAPTR